MASRSFTGNPSELIVEQLAASGVKYVFYNSGSREAPFFDALMAHPDVHGILALHEGSVTAMAGGYTQVNGDPAVMVVHLGAGLAQCMGQLRCRGRFALRGRHLKRPSPRCLGALGRHPKRLLPG